MKQEETKCLEEDVAHPYLPSSTYYIVETRKTPH